MPSPFPGMNPYIERADVWNDFHDSFIPAAREMLAPQVRPRYYIRIEEHLFIHEPPARKRFPFGRPDLSIHSARDPVAGTSRGAAAPATVGLPAVVEEQRLPYLEIRDRDRNQVVTVIELLSPVNKATGSGRDQYLAKVQRVLASGTNFVEIDLLRGEPRMPWEGLLPCDYYAIVSRPADRAQDPPRADLWAIGLRDPLPTVPIPLRPGEPEPSLDLQAILHRIYDAADYHLFLYDADPNPPLPAADTVWAAQILHPPANPA
jgi:hypothetical protein